MTDATETVPFGEKPPLSPQYTDALTGLANRRWLVEEIDYLTYDRPGEYALVFLDLDGFKQENDTNGHDAGDEMLKTTGEVLKGSTRHNDFYKKDEYPAKDARDSKPGTDTLGHIVRLGGDEFVVILPGVANEDQLKVVTDRVRKNLERNPDRSIKASIGGHIHKPGETASDVLKGADQAMYKNKQARKAEQRLAEEAEWQANYLALPRHRRLAYRLGRKAVKLSGVKPLGH